MLSPRPPAPAPQPLLPVPRQVRDAVSSARVWFLDMGKAVQTPGHSRMTMPGQPQGPQPPWADRILEHILGGEPDVPTCSIGLGLDVLSDEVATHY